MIKKSFSILILLLFFFKGFAQTDPVLVSIEGKDFYVSEYNYLFGKNASLIAPEEKEDLDRNVNLFVDYQLKVLEAENQKLDTLTSFKDQYQSYKNQLANDYMLDTEVGHHLVEEAYERLLKEREVSYILIRLDEHASPQDTLTAYNRAMEFKEKVEAGGDFEQLALQYSQDPSVKNNRGLLGWVKVFKTVYPFENMVYQMEVGEVSEPFRSKFGYHVLRVNQERKAEGKVQVAQILVKHDEENPKEDYKKIRNIYNKLRTGARFEDLVKQYSDDESTRDKGGMLNAFDKGSLKSEVYENKAFELTPENPISEPFQTEWGWHILKLVSSYPIQSFEKEKKELTFKIKQNSRSTLIRDSLNAQLLKKYPVEESQPGIAYFKDKVGEDFVEKAEASLPEKDLIHINGNSKSYAEFLDALQKHHKYAGKAINEELIDEVFYQFKANLVYDYVKRNLAEIDPDYAKEIKDHREGLLIYELIRSNVWERSDDSIELKKFFLKNQELFKEPERYKMMIVSADDKKTASMVYSALASGKSEEEIRSMGLSIIINSGVYGENHPQVPTNFSKKPGVSQVIGQNAVYLVAKTIEVIPAGIPDFENVKGKAVQLYQESIEKDLMENLRKKYKAQINQTALEGLKQ